MLPCILQLSPICKGMLDSIMLIVIPDLDGIIIVLPSMSPDSSEKSSSSAFSTSSSLP
jgi:hypothetical protein